MRKRNRTGRGLRARKLKGGGGSGLYREVKSELEEVSKWVKQIADDTERILRARVIHDLLMGKKCRGCGEMKDVEEVREVDTREGRSVPLCASCRKVAGIEDDEPQKKE